MRRVCAGYPENENYLEMPDSSKTNPNHINNLENIINNCFLNVINFTAKPLTSGISALTDEEKNQGSVCIDIGAGKTSVSTFIDGSNRSFHSNIENFSYILTIPSTDPGTPDAK